MPQHNLQNPTTMPVIIEEIFYHPFGARSLFLFDEENIAAANLAANDGDLVFVGCAKNSQDNQDGENFYDVGVIGSILRKVALPDGRLKILLQLLTKGKIISIKQRNPLQALVEIINYKQYNVKKIEAMLKVLKEKVHTLANNSQIFSMDELRALDDNDEPNRVIDLVASALRLKKGQSYALLLSDDVEYRMSNLLDLVSEEIQLQKLQKEIRSRVHNKMEQTNREYFLKEQLRQIQKELGVDKQRDEEIDQYYKKLESIKPFLGEDAYKEISKQINRLSRMHQDSGDANILQNYVEWVLEIPFGVFAKESLLIKKVQKQLDLDHYSLQKPKERIIEYFAVKELLARKLLESSDKKSKKTILESTALFNNISNQTPNQEDIKNNEKSINNQTNDNQNISNPNHSPSKQNQSSKKYTKTKATILCFYGPPGVGKTSLANSIATAIGRPLVRIALGGLEDVNELRGHRRTYIGAMPGRIVQGLIEAKTMNPVMVLDEVDKVARGVRGDPTSVLLEILDPEQNVAFRDYYTNFSLDLSQIIFIATANDVATIPPPLRDRMEFIELSSYTPQEKEQIAKKYLIPQELAQHALSNKDLEFTKESIKTLIEKYTREAGVRNLRRVIATIMRKVATKILSDSDFTKIKITPKNIPTFLDKIVFEIDSTQKTPRIGVVNGLAWTSVGGDLLKIEAIKILGKGGLVLTGNLGDVMKESAQIAHSVVKARIDNGTLKAKSIKPKHLKSIQQNANPKNTTKISAYNIYDIHLHVPEGATPKDGPSAGIAIACAIASILSEIPLRGDIAMTGELTLSGDVLPIGGLKEKLIAAHKAGVKKAIIPQKNYERDLAEIPDEVKNKLKIVGVTKLDEVLSHSLV